MPRLDVPADKDPLVFLWTERAQPLTSTAGAFSDALIAKMDAALYQAIPNLNAIFAASALKLSIF